MMLNPWIFGLEAVQQGWQAQNALAFRVMRSFVGGAPDQTRSSPLIPNTVAVDIKAQEEVAAIADVREAPAATNEQEAPAEITDVRRRRAPKVGASLKTSSLKARSSSKRAAAASQNSARKAVHRSARKRR
jgi:hypothetical protein